MASIRSSTAVLLSLVVILVVLPGVSHAFGAGNIGSTSKIEGVNWRHGDIEDTLLTILISRAAGGRKFSKMDVKRTYFGNWLRDYSQAVDVGTVKSVSAEAIRLIIWVLGFLTFGYGTREFEVTSERLGCYRAENHIDNPLGIPSDAQRYDRRLRGPVDEQKELAIDPRTGLKNYIANETVGITTSAGFIRDIFGRCIYLGRQYARTKNEDDLFEALRLLGTGCHCLEDYSAHSNYVELALMEMGERNVFPHVGRKCLVQVQGSRDRIHPIVTGTFGGVDFLHSVMGEFSDKATQSEISELEGAIEQSQNNSNASIVKELLDKLPSGLLGGDKKSKADELQANSTAAAVNNVHITPMEPEAFTRQLQDISKQIYPILEFHDQIMKSINEAIEKIPILPALIDQIQDQINIFVFSLMAPFIVPVIRQVKAELQTGSSEVIEGSRDKQHNTFRNDYEDNPTHSMLSKDHFSNILNEPAGKIASQILKWSVPQLIACWDDERIDPNRTITRIINGVFHHPALRHLGDDGARDGRELMFGVVQQWFGGKDESERQALRQQLSREGVEQGRNHKEGVLDSGHGCGKPLAISSHNNTSNPLSGITGTYGTSGTSAVDHVSKMANEAAGGGPLGGLVGGLVGGVGASLLGGAFGESKDQHSTWQQQGREAGGGYSSSVTEAAHHRGSSNDGERWGQAEYRETSYAGGHERQEYSRYEQSGSYDNADYGYQRRVDTRPSYDNQGQSGYVRRTEERFSRGGEGSYQTEVHEQRFDTSGERESQRPSRHHDDRPARDQREQSCGDYAAEDRLRRAEPRNDYGRQEPERETYGRRDEYDRQELERETYGRHGDYGRQEPERETYGRQDNYGRQEPPSDEYAERPRRRYDGGDDDEREERGGFGGEQDEYGRGERRGYGRQDGGYGDEY